MASKHARVMGCSRSGAVVAFLVCMAELWAGAGGLAAQTPEPGAGDEGPAMVEAEAESDLAATAEPAAEALGAEPADPGFKVWGGDWYQVAAQDIPDAATVSDWTASQSAGLSLNLQSASGLEILMDLSADLNSLDAETVDSVVQQLSIRFAPVDWLSVAAGKQRLKWGTGKIFAALDKGEGRANPLDSRSVVTGVTGIKAEILPLDWLGLSLLWLPESDLRWSRYAARADISIFDAGLDIGVGAIKYEYDPWAASSAWSTGGNVASGLNVDKLDRVACMADFAWGVGAFTVYGEAELRFGRETGYWFPGMASAMDYSNDSRDAPVFRGLAGLMAQVDLGLSRAVTVVGEYLYNGDGLSQDEAQGFYSSYHTWKDDSVLSALSGALPASFADLGNFRKHYAGLSLSGIALDRYFLVSGSLIAGLDSGLLLGTLSLDWELPRGTRVVLSWKGITSCLDETENPSEVMFLPWRDVLSLTVSTSF